jgi:hypothetical protein
MRETRITLPELALVAGTRAALGAGLGLLLADRLSREQRRAAGWSLFLFGALTTIPIVFEVFGGHRLSGSSRRPEPFPRRPSSADRDVIEGSTQPYERGEPIPARG